MTRLGSWRGLEGGVLTWKLVNDMQLNMKIQVWEGSRFDFFEVIFGTGVFAGQQTSGGITKTSLTLIQGSDL